MRKLIGLLLLSAIGLIAQPGRSSLMVTRIYNITSSWVGECGTGVVDNRSSATRQNNYHAVAASGSGNWSVVISYSDASCTGPWTSFGSIATINQASFPAVAVAIDNLYNPHPYIQIVVTGSATAVYTASRDYFSAPTAGSGGSISFPISVVQGGTNASSASGARTNLGAASSGANGDITSLTGLTTPLAVGQGGTGAAAFTTGALVYKASSALAAMPLGTAVQVLHGNASGPPAWGPLDLASDTSGQLPFGSLSGTVSFPSQFASGQVQGSGSKVLSSATIAGTAVMLCTDATGAATTAGCPSYETALTFTPPLQRSGSTISILASPTFTGLTLSGIAGTTQCIHANSSGVLSGTGSDCGTGSGGANANGFYVVTTSTSAPANGINLGVLPSGLLLMSVSAGTATLSTAVAGTNYAGPTNGTASQGLTSDGSGGFGTPVTLAASATTDTTNAGNILTGTLGVDRLPSGLDHFIASGPTVPRTFAFPDANATIIYNGYASASLAGLTLSGVAGGGTQCLHVNNAGLVSGSGSDCGAGSGGANANGFYWVSTSTNAPTNGVNLGLLTTGLVKISVSGGVATPTTAAAGTDYAGPANGTNGQGLTSNGSGGFGTPVTLAASATTDTTNAANISSGTLNAGRLPSGLDKFIAAGLTAARTFTLPDANATLIYNGYASASLAGLTLPSISGSTQCLHVSSSGVVSGTGADCGSTGSSGANSNGFYVVNQSANAPTNAVNLGALATGLLKMTVSGGVATLTAGVAGTEYEVPLTFSGPLSRSTNTISIPAATGSVNGYLTSADWSTFNSKLSSAFYQTVKRNGVAQTQRAATNFSLNFTTTDDLANGQTSIDLASSLSVTNLTAGGTLTLSAISGLTQCLHVNSSGVISGTTSDCSGTTLLSGIGAATSSNTIANGNNPQTWQWSISTAARSGLRISESSAGSAAGFQFTVDTLAGSSVLPVRFTAQGTADGVQMSTAAVFGPIGSGVINANQYKGNAQVAVADGGTGSSTAAGARTNLGTAASGPNSDITSLSGLTTALSIAQGGTGATSSSAARTSLGVAASGANSDITSLAGLTTPLTVSQGGSGRGTFTSNGVVYGAGTSALQVTAAGGTGTTCLQSVNGAAPSFAACGSPLSGISAASASNTINNGDSDQAWKWSLTTVGKTAFTFSENSASTGSSTTILRVNTASGSTAKPISITAGGTANGVEMSTAGALSSIGSGVINANQYFGNATIAVANGGTGSTTTSGARTSLGVAALGANSDITSLSGLTTPLTVPQGGTGAGSFTTNGVLYGGGSGVIHATAAGSTGTQCLTSVSGAAPSFASCPGLTLPFSGGWIPSSWSGISTYTDAFSVNINSYPNADRHATGFVDAIVGEVLIPAGATYSSGGHASGVAGYAVGQTTGNVAPVGVYGQATLTASSQYVFGANFLISNCSDGSASGYGVCGSGLSGTLASVVEANPNFNSSSGSLAGFNVVGNSSAVPTLSFGVRVAAPGPFAYWSNSYYADHFSGNVGLWLGYTSAGVGSSVHNSQAIYFNSTNGTTASSPKIYADANNWMELTLDTTNTFIAFQNPNGVMGAFGDSGLSLNKGLSYYKGEFTAGLGMTPILSSGSTTVTAGGTVVFSVPGSPTQGLYEFSAWVSAQSAISGTFTATVNGVDSVGSYSNILWSLTTGSPTREFVNVPFWVNSSGGNVTFDGSGSATNYDIKYVYRRLQ